MLAQPPIWFILIAFICAIGPLVFFHEMGHYLVARWFGIGAEQFSIGFGKEIVGWTDRRGTRWKVGWLPVGGYVRFIGDMNPASQPPTGPQSMTAGTTAMGAVFHERPWWQRFLVVLAGPVANFLLAIVIFATFFAALGYPNTPPVAAAVERGSAAQTAGIRPGDRFVSIAGQATQTFDDIRRIVSIREGEQVSIQLVRDDRTIDVNATIGHQDLKDDFGQEMRLGLLGVAPPKREYERLSVVDAISTGARFTAVITRSTVDLVGQIVSGRRSAKDLGGPLKMAQVAGQQLTLGAFEFVWLVGLFSINLGFINLLPVPMLDGGHLVFYAAEAVRRKPVSARIQDWAFRGGLALLLALIVFVTLNDLSSFGLFERLGRLIG